MIDEGNKDYCEIKYLTESSKIGKLMDEPKFYKTPIVRNGKKATIGYCPEIWKQWD